MYSAIPIHWNIKSDPASPGRSRVGSALYVFSLLGTDGEETYCGGETVKGGWSISVVAYC